MTGGIVRPSVQPPKPASRLAELLRPLSDEEAAGLHLVTPAEITAALRRVAPPQGARWPRYL